ncbi:MAG TPA: glycosyltransferase, partial [Devosia sp.]|nr:glycosyltransferase [Devosia sp.]
MFVIPAFRPSPDLFSVVAELRNEAPDIEVVVVDDGGGESYFDLFRELEEQLGVTVLRHAVNLGKGAALKTAMNWALVKFPSLLGIVAADADG